MRACRRWYNLRGCTRDPAWLSCLVGGGVMRRGTDAGGVAAGRSCSCPAWCGPIDRVDRVSCRQDSRVLTGRGPSDWRARRNGRSQPRCSAPSGDRLVLLVQVLSRGVWYPPRRAASWTKRNISERSRGDSWDATRCEQWGGRGGNGESRGVAWRGEARRDEARRYRRRSDERRLSARWWVSRVCRWVKLRRARPNGEGRETGERAAWSRSPSGGEHGDGETEQGRKRWSVRRGKERKVDQPSRGSKRWCREWKSDGGDDIARRSTHTKRMVPRWTGRGDWTRRLAGRLVSR